MATRTWDLDLPDGRRHRVELEHSYWTGRHEIRLDGIRVQAGGKFWWNFGGNFELPVPGHQVFVRIRTNLFRFSYDLVVDGRSIETGEPFDLREPVQVLGNAPMAGIFAVLCIVPAVVGRLGLWAALVAGAAAGSCYWIAKQDRIPSSTRAWFCAGIVGITWVVSWLFWLARGGVPFR